MTHRSAGYARTSHQYHHHLQHYDCHCYYCYSSLIFRAECFGLRLGSWEQLPERYSWRGTHHARTHANPRFVNACFSDGVVNMRMGRSTNQAARVPRRLTNLRASWYGGTSLIRNRPTLAPYSSFFVWGPMVVLGGVAVSCERETPVQHIPSSVNSLCGQ